MSDARLIRLTPKSTLNKFVGCLGKRGTGKSNRAMAAVLELRRERSCYVLIHDLGARLPTTIYPSVEVEVADGGYAEGGYKKQAIPKTGVNVVYVDHDSIESCQAALATDPNGFHRVNVADADELLYFAEEVANASMRAHGGHQGVPVAVVIDEAVVAGVCDTHSLSDQMKRLVALCRHLNVAIFWTCQGPRLLHNQMIAQATDLHIFRLTAAADLDRLEKSGVDPEVIEVVKTLPDYHCISTKI